MFCLLKDFFRRVNFILRVLMVVMAGYLNSLMFSVVSSLDWVLVFVYSYLEK